MRASARSALVVASLAAAGAGFAFSESASGGNPVNVVVLIEHGVGTSSVVQPQLDQFLGIAVQQNGWDPTSHGKYFTSRGPADAWIKSDGPHYGIFSLGAFLALKSTYNLEVIGEARTSTGGEQYFVVSSTASDLAGCKGKKLSTDQDDPRFVDKIIFAGQAKLADFTLVQTTRFAVAHNNVLNDVSECALINEAQLASLAKNNAAGKAKTVWSSAKLPGMPMVAFPSAPSGEKTAFQKSLDKLCTGNNAGTCSTMQIISLSANTAPYPALVAQY